ncbi:immunity 17 family protein [Parabacteroides goldsteinii]|nr:immunity 17 family protein [Parabacteroides goldsteinii]
MFNFDWYFETSGATTFVNKFGRKGARIFYALLGLALIGCGTLGLIYW